MASIIEGYTYDIFISYRQKDNKGDRWVSEFVDALKDELESTFKEEVSVYFDINPHDGLLETHDVDASLKEKLKCLVFIPIISQTYCDSKSFAWQHEFCTFNKLAKEDLFGRDIRLTSGNVSSRVLPVKIHDLDPEDKTLIENELGGVLRCIEFIYKSAGVNRPLRSNEDHPQDNLNKIYYRDQINKVANAVKEIITAIKKHNQQDGEILENVKKGKPLPSRFLNKRIIIASIITLALILFGIFFIPRLLKSLKPIEKSIAVLPFRNDSPDDSTQYFMNGVMDELLTRLQFIEELRVISRTSVEQYRGTNKTIPEIANDLKVNFIVEGSGQKIGKSFRIRVQLIRAKNESHLWGNNFEQQILTMTEYFKAQSGFVKDIANQLQALISPGEKKLIVKIPTEDITAYEAYLKGQFYVKTFNLNELDTALYYFELAKEKDPEFALAYAGISYIWLSYQQIGKITPDEAGPKIMSAIETALALDSTLADVHYTLAMINFVGMWDWKKSELEFKKAIAINPNYADAQALYSFFLSIMGRPEEAIKHIECAIKLDPKNPMIKATYSQVLFFTRRYDEAISVSRELLDKNPTMFVALDPLFNALHMTGRDEEAFEALKLYFTNMYKDFAHVFDQYPKLGYTGTLNLEGDTLLTQSKTKYILPIELAYFYVFSGNKKLTLDCLEKAYEIHDPNTIIITSPTYDILRNEPRFQELLRKLNIPNYD